MIKRLYIRLAVVLLVALVAALAAWFFASGWAGYLFPKGPGNVEVGCIVSSRSDSGVFTNTCLTLPWLLVGFLALLPASASVALIAWVFRR